MTSQGTTERHKTTPTAWRSCHGVQFAPNFTKQNVN